MEENKYPGKDGIPTEFYITFWHLIKNDFTELINHIFFVKEELTESMKTAIISISRKKILMTDITKWRPISLYVDYKIIMKALTNRLLPTLEEIISIEQSAAVPNRTIYNNLFAIRDVIEYSNKKKTPNIYPKLRSGKSI